MSSVADTMKIVAKHKLRVNVKSLAAESRFIRHEMRRTRNPEVKATLACHRALRVKPEARLAHLALAFVKGVPYRHVEQKAKTAVQSAELAKKVGRFAYLPDCETAVRSWLEE